MDRAGGADCGWLRLFAQPAIRTNDVRFVYVVEPRFTIDDVQRIAAGEQTNSDLVQALRDSTAAQAMFAWRVPGDPVFTVGFVDGRGMRHDTRTFGWPGSWVTQKTFTLYDDAVARQGMRPMRTRTAADRTDIIMPEGALVSANSGLDDTGLVWPRPRWSWGTYGGGYLAYRPTPEETAGQALWIDVNTYGVISVIGLIVLGWVLPRIVIWLLNVVRGRAKPRWRGRVAGWCGALLVAGMIAWLTVKNAVHTDVFIAPMRMSPRAGAPSQFLVHQGMEHSSIRLSQIPSLVESRDGNQIAAQAILAALKDTPRSTQYLAVALTPESILHNGNSQSVRSLPLVNQHSTQYMRRSDIGPAELMANPKGVTWSFQNSYLQRRVSSGDPNKAETSTSVNIGAFGLLALGAWVLWLLARFVCRMITMFIVARRRRRYECIACGYVLAPRSSAGAS